MGLNRLEDEIEGIQPDSGEREWDGDRNMVTCLRKGRANCEMVDSQKIGMSLLTATIVTPNPTQ